MVVPNAKGIMGALYSTLRILSTVLYMKQTKPAKHNFWKIKPTPA